MKRKYITPSMRKAHLSIEHIVSGSPITSGNNIAIDDTQADLSDDLAKSVSISFEDQYDQE